MPTSTVSESDWLGDVVDKRSGPQPGGRPAKGHNGKQRKLHCERCGFICYATRRAVERFGYPSCACGERMVLANLRDRALIEWDTLEAELLAQGRDTFEAAMRELGFTGMVALGGERKTGGDQHRCAFATCTRWTAAEYCEEHEGYRPAMGSAYKGRAA
jgi:hypothetical protein